MNVLDSHQHFWDLSNSFTAWPTPDLKPIYRNFMADDLREILQGSNVDGTILIQSAPVLAETLFLLGMADEHDFVKGVIGWIDFEASDARDQLVTLGKNKWFRGLRPMVQDISEIHWLLRPQFNPLFIDIECAGFIFDALVYCEQIPDVAELASRYPSLSIVLDHAGKPDIAAGNFGPWATNIEKLAKNSNVSCKLSGLWTEAGNDHSIKTIGPYVDHLVGCFGTNRLLWGSDWPVLELVGSYRGWLNQCQLLLADHLAEELAAVFGGNARRIYGLD